MSKPKIEVVNHTTAPFAIRDRKVFRNSTGNLHGGVVPSWKTGTGRLNVTEAALYAAHHAAGPLYAVFSFDTPIAWWTAMYGWHVVDQKFSVITSTKHQSRLYLIPRETEEVSS